MSSRDLASVHICKSISNQSIGLVVVSSPSWVVILVPGGHTNLILVVLMQIDTTPLRLPPKLRHALIDVGLVYNLGDILGHIIDQR